VRTQPVVAAIVVALGVAACSGHSKAASDGNGSTGSPNPATVPAGPTPGPTVTAVAGGVKAPVTTTQLSSVFGTSLSGPRAATNGSPTLVYGDITSTSGAHPHLLVSVSIYSPSILRQRGTTPGQFYDDSNEPTAEQLTGIGQKAFIVQDQITVLTKKNYVLVISANQQVREDELESAARQAASKL
jgi:hypothetical protein